MRGRLVASGLLLAGLSFFLPLTSVRADYQIYSTNDPIGNPAGYIAANQAGTAANQNPSLILPPTDTNVAPNTPGVLNDPFAVQQFDPSKVPTMFIAGAERQATLYEVVVSLQYEFQNTIQMSFTKPSTTTVTATGLMNLQMFDPKDNIVKDANGNPIVYALGQSGQPGFTTSKTLAYPTQITNPNYVDPTPKIISGTSALGYTDSSVLNTFTGNGQMTLPVYAEASSTFNNNAGNGVGGSRTSVSAALSVTYYYYYVPEPSSMVLTGLGAFGLCLITRVRSHREVSAVA